MFLVPNMRRPKVNTSNRQRLASPRVCRFAELKNEVAAVTRPSRIRRSKFGDGEADEVRLGRDFPN